MQILRLDSPLELLRTLFLEWRIKFGEGQRKRDWISGCLSILKENWKLWMAGVLPWKCLWDGISSGEVGIMNPEVQQRTYSGANGCGPWCNQWGFESVENVYSGTGLLGQNWEQYDKYESGGRVNTYPGKE